jgi:hypothetical protein
MWSTRFLAAELSVVRLNPVVFFKLRALYKQYQNYYESLTLRIDCKEGLIVISLDRES